MADRVVQVQVDVVPGSTAGIDQAKQKAGEATRAGRQAGQAAPAPAPAPSAPSGQSSDGQRGGQAGAEEQLGRLAQGMGRVAQVAQGGVGGVMGLASAMGPLGAAFGAATAGGLALGGAVSTVTQFFKASLPTLAEVSQRVQAFTSDLARTRQTGLAEADAFRRAFEQRPEVLQRLTAAQNAGNRPAQRAILEEERAQAAQDVATEQARNPEQAQADLAAELTRALGQFRAGGAQRGTATRNLQRNIAGGLRGQTAQRIDELWAQAGGRPEDMPDALRNLQASEITPQLVEQLSGTLSQRLVNARQRQAQSEAALGPGGMPSLRPGAPQMPEGVWQNRTGNVLDLHAQIQSDLVRDQREEARFQQTFRLWTEYLEEMRRIGQAVVT